VGTPHNQNLDRLLLPAVAEHEPIAVGTLVRAALPYFSDSYVRTRIRELLARGFLEQRESGGPIRITTAGRTELDRLHASEEREAAA
jgi:hypothetical protein